jgi:hypothetical protein
MNERATITTDDDGQVSKGMPIAAEKPSDRTDLTDAPDIMGTPLPPVKGAGKMAPTGYVPENDAYFEILTEVVDGRRQGRGPMTIPRDVLTAAGHGRRRSESVIAAMGDIPLAEGVKGYKTLRRQCLLCAENVAEVRRCVIIDCPIWSYRIGRNPHNPRRGKNPFAVVL